MTDKKNPQVVKIIYAGQRIDMKNSIFHRYYVVGLGEDLSDGTEIQFSKKLQPYHRIGGVFSAERDGSHFITSKAGELARQIGTYEHAATVAEWMKADAEAQRLRTSKNDEKKLARIIKEDLSQIRRMYQRGSPHQKRVILEKVVNELERQR